MSKATAPKPELVPSFSTVIGQRADPYRRQKRIRVEVNVIPREQMLGEASVPKGRALVDIPEGMLPLIEALVIDETKEQMAIQSLERLEADWLEKNPAGSKLLSPHSVSSAYRAMFGHDMGALRYCKVIERDIPAPLTDEESRAVNVAATMARKGA